MLIEYQIRFVPGGVTVTQRVDPESFSEPAGPAPTGVVASQNSLGSVHGGSGGAGPRLSTGPGGGGPRLATGPGGAGPRLSTGPGGAGGRLTTGPGGSASPAPVIILGPTIIGGINGHTAEVSDATFHVEPQEQVNWCWAAVTVGVDHYFSPQSQLTQCSLAGKVLGRNDCCSDAVKCDKAMFLEDALQAVNRPPEIQPPLSFAEIRQQIDAGRPICVRISWPGQFRGHFVVIFGYKELATGEQLLEIADPFYGDSILDFESFTSSYQGSGQWTNTYLVK